MQTFLIVVIVVALVILAAVFGRQIGRSVKGGIAFASVLLGFGMVIDPPARHGIESVEAERDDAEAEKDGE